MRIVRVTGTDQFVVAPPFVRAPGHDSSALRVRSSRGASSRVVD